MTLGEKATPKNTFPLMPEDYAAIGMAIVSLSRLENLLTRIAASHVPVDKTHSAIERNQGRFQKAVQNRLPDLFKTVEKLPEMQALPPEERAEYRETFSRLVVWRNTLCHGTVQRTPKGKLFLEFWDRHSFDTPEGMPGRTIGPKKKPFAPAELLRLTQSASELSLKIAQIFSLT